MKWDKYNIFNFRTRESLRRIKYCKLKLVFGGVSKYDQIVIEMHLLHFCKENDTQTGKFVHNLI